MIPESPWNTKRRKSKGDKCAVEEIVIITVSLCYRQDVLTDECKQRRDIIPSLLWVLAQVRCQGLPFSPDRKKNTLYYPDHSVLLI